MLQVILLITTSLLVPKWHPYSLSLTTPAIHHLCLLVSLAPLPRLTNMLVITVLHYLLFIISITETVVCCLLCHCFSLTLYSNLCGDPS